MSRKLVIRKPISREIRLILGFLSVALVLGVYEIVSLHQHRVNPSDTTIPGLERMAVSFYDFCCPDVSGHIWLLDDGQATLFRLLLGLGLGITSSILLGVGMGCFSLLESFCLPGLSFFAKIPPTALLAVFFVLVGHDLEMFVAMISFGVLPTLTQAVYQSAKYDVHEELVNKAYTLGGGNLEVIVNVVMHQILPRIIEAVRLQVGPAMVFLIAAEWSVADVGFGYRLRMQSRLLNMGVVYDYILLLGCLGCLADWGLTRLRNKICPWFILEK